MMRWLALILAIAVSGCAGMGSNDEVARIAAAIEARHNALVGFVDIDPGQGYVKPGEKKAAAVSDDALSQALTRLDRLLGSGKNLYGDEFDPNRTPAPDYKKPVYKSQITKQILLDDLMRSAYDAYEDVTGKKWYPKRFLENRQSGDPLLRGDRWWLSKGSSLHAGLAQWGRRAQWKVVWRSDYEYLVDAGVVFKGNFTAAVREVLGVFENRTPRLHATFYKNRVVVFSNEKVE